MRFLAILVVVLMVGCVTDYKSDIVVKRINSKQILDSLHQYSDSIGSDTAKFMRTPISSLFFNKKDDIITRVLEKPKGKIAVIIKYKSGKQIFVAEYFANGQIMCDFSVTNEGIRNGQYKCYYEDGRIRTSGYYLNNKEIQDSSKHFNTDGRLIK